MQLLATSLDQAKIAMIRAEMPVLAREVYLNTGSNGPMTRRGVQTIIDCAREELENGRIGQPVNDRNDAITSEARGLFAELLGCTLEEIALTHNTTEGMNIALMGLDWQPGDKLVTATTEHEGGLNPSALVKARYGARVIYTDIGLCDCDPLFSLKRALSPRTKAVVLSHVSWATGAVLPLRELCEMAHRVGALVICDAAQAAGMIPAQVRETNVDAYAVSGQKWLCGPDGTGALYVRRDRLEQIQNTFTGYWGIKTRVAKEEDEIQFGDTAQRYHYAANYMPACAGLNETLKWIRDKVGWEWVYQRTREIGQYAYAALSELPNVTLYLQPENIVGLLHFSVKDIAPADVTARLFEQRIMIRHTPNPILNRVSAGFYNTEEDIEKLVSAIKAL